MRASSVLKTVSKLSAVIRNQFLSAASVMVPEDLDACAAVAGVCMINCSSAIVCPAFPHEVVSFRITYTLI